MCKNACTCGVRIIICSIGVCIVSVTVSIKLNYPCLSFSLSTFTDAKGLSAASKKKVEIFQEQILQSLENRTKTMYPVSPQRFSKLLLRLAPLKAISLEVMQHMEVQRALGNAKMDNLFGELLDFE